MLRKQLYTGLLPLLIILFVLDGYVFYQFQYLDRTFEEVQQEDYRGILALKSITFLATRLDRAIALSNAQQKETSQRLAADVFSGLDQQLSVQRELVKSSAEEEELEKLEGLVADLESAFASLTERPIVESSFWSNRVNDLIDRIIRQSDQLVALKNEGLIERVERYREDVRRSHVVLLLVTLLAIILALVFSHVMSRKIVAPIEELTRSASQLAKGNWDLVIRPSGKGEISSLSHAFNKLVVQLREYRRITNQKLSRSRRRIEIFLENDPNPIFFAEAKGRVTYKNPEASRLFESQNWDDTIPEALEELVGQVLLNRKAHFETDLRRAVVIHREGERFFYLPQIIPLESAEDHMDVLSVVLQDVTKLRLADDLKSNVLATVSHEVKTPLTSAVMSICLTLDASFGELNERQRDLLETARKDLDRILNLLKNVLDFTRLEAGAAQLLFERASPADIVRGAFEALKHEVHMNDMAMGMMLENDLPEVEIDSSRIRVVFSNLVSNAIKHSPKGSRIVLYARRENVGVRFGVTDQGEGVPENARREIFEKFYRSPGQKTTGAGLGLNISREIVVAHGGWISCENQPAGGADFFFILPRREPSSDTEGEDSDQHSASSPDRARSREKSTSK